MEIRQNKSKFGRSKSLFVLLLLILVACESKLVPEGTVTVNQDVPIMSTATNLPTETNEAVTVTDISIPTATSNSLVETPTPTLSLAEKETITSELYNTNGNCKLPCWWGIVPGETDWQIAENFFSTIATKISTSAESETDPHYSASIDVPVPEYLSEYRSLRHNFSIRDGTIAIIHLERSQETSNIYTISEILNTYGHPPEIWLDTLGENYGDNYFPFEIVLFYPQKGILVRYFENAELIDNFVIGCPRNHSGKLTLWSPELELTFAEALSGTNALGSYGEQYYKLLEETTEMDVEMFYQTYLDPDAETCITTPAELWLNR